MATFVPKKNRVQEPVQKVETPVAVVTPSNSIANQKNQTNQTNDLIIVARIGVAYGVKGWVKIHPFSHSPDALQNAARWSIAPYIPDQSVADAAWQQVTPKGFKAHADAWVGVVDGWNDRTMAEKFKGWQIAVSRDEFPQTDDDEFYWVDLLGAQVVNQDGVLLGEVTQLFENAAHTVMSVVPQNSESAKPVEYLIPFVSAFVGKVDVQSQSKTIAVTWDVDATA
jgi:16S rRNA processing protein RimM